MWACSVKETFLITVFLHMKENCRQKQVRLSDVQNKRMRANSHLENFNSLRRKKKPSTVVKHCIRLSREAVEPQSLEIFTTCLKKL